MNEWRTSIQELLTIVLASLCIFVVAFRWKKRLQPLAYYFCYCVGEQDKEMFVFDLNPTSFG